MTQYPMTFAPQSSTPPKRTRFGGLAWSSLVIGIVGIVFSIVPFVNNLTAMAAVVGFILGVIALFGTKKIVASFGVAACIAAMVFTVMAQSAWSDTDSGATIVDDNQEAASGETGQQADESGAALGTRDNPLTLGTTIEMGDWTLAVADVTLDATDKVLNENPFNDKPVKGRQFVMFAVKATYEGQESGTAWMDFSWAIVGNKGNTFGGASMDDNCGVIPNPLDDTGETFPGGKVRGNVCYSVPSNQLDGAVIRIEESFSFEDTRAFYALR